MNGAKGCGLQHALLVERYWALEAASTAHYLSSPAGCLGVTGGSAARASVHVVTQAHSWKLDWALY